jgi:O-acetyl-ADP-ribose deacetylase (regulator of RNase III)
MYIIQATLFALLTTSTSAWALPFNFDDEPKPPCSAELDAKRGHLVAKISDRNAKRMPEQAKVNVLPPGSAIITSSGALAATGITAILHAATGSSGREGPAFSPTLSSVRASIENSLILAKEFGHKRVALPFVGGKIFLGRIGVEPRELAQTIVDAAVASRDGMALVFVIYNSAVEADLFKAALARYPDAAQFATVAQGSITDFSLHHATAIINAANTEVFFGDGVSGAIGNATKAKLRIEDEAQKAIAAYNKFF